MSIARTTPAQKRRGAAMQHALAVTGRAPAQLCAARSSEAERLRLRRERGARGAGCGEERADTARQASRRLRRGPREPADGAGGSSRLPHGHPTSDRFAASASASPCRRRPRRSRRRAAPGRPGRRRSRPAAQSIVAGRAPGTSSGAPPRAPFRPRRRRSLRSDSVAAPRYSDERAGKAEARRPAPRVAAATPRCRPARRVPRALRAARSSSSCAQASVIRRKVHARLRTVSLMLAVVARVGCGLEAAMDRAVLAARVVPGTVHSHSMPSISAS